MKTTVRLLHRGDMRCETDMSGVKLRIDALKHKSLPDFGHSPLDLLAMAHGACTGMLTAMKGGSEGIDVKDMGIEVVHAYDDGPPMRMKAVKIRFSLSKAITPEQEEKLRAAAAMCPVHTALRHDIPVTMEFEVRKQETR